MGKLGKANSREGKREDPGQMAKFKGFWRWERMRRRAHSHGGDPAERPPLAGLSHSASTVTELHKGGGREAEKGTGAPGSEKDRGDV